MRILLAAALILGCAFPALAREGPKKHVYSGSRSNTGADHPQTYAPYYRTNGPHPHKTHFRHSRRKHPDEH